MSLNIETKNKKILCDHEYVMYSTYFLVINKNFWHDSKYFLDRKVLY